MKNFIKFSIFMLMYIILTFLFSGCGPRNPVEKLINHLDKIVSILEENVKDIDKAVALTENYLNDNIDEISELSSISNMPEEIKKIKEGLVDLNFVFLLSSIVERVNNLEKNYPMFMHNQRIIFTLESFNEVFSE